MHALALDGLAGITMITTTVHCKVMLVSKQYKGITYSEVPDTALLAALPIPALQVQRFLRKAPLPAHGMGCVGRVVFQTEDP